MKKRLVPVLVTLALGVSACKPEKQDIMAVEQVTLTTDADKQAYSLGANFGAFLYQQKQDTGLDINGEMVVKGLVAALKDQAQLDEQQVQEHVRALQAAIGEKRQEMEAAKGEANLKEGEMFLAENAKKEGVMVTDSGLQYQVVTPGDGPKPTADDTVKVHYHGTLIDGTVFDSSVDRNEPAVFPLRRVISGWTEGVQLMNVGSKVRFFIPSNLAYGGRATGKIGANSTLIFDVELLSIETPEGTK